jgi:hypothetical protein
VCHPVSALHCTALHPCGVLHGYVRMAVGACPIPLAHIHGYRSYGPAAAAADCAPSGASLTRRMTCVAPPGNLLFAGRKVGQPERDFFRHTLCTHVTEKVSAPLNFVLDSFKRFSAWCAPCPALPCPALPSCCRIDSKITCLPHFATPCSHLCCAVLCCGVAGRCVITCGAVCHMARCGAVWRGVVR